MNNAQDKNSLENKYKQLKVLVVVLVAGIVIMSSLQVFLHYKSGQREIKMTECSNSQDKKCIEKVNLFDFECIECEKIFDKKDLDN